MMKVYLKRGSRTDDERKMESALSDYVKKQMGENPDFKFEPAKNSAQLKSLYHKHMASDAVVLSETKNPEPAKPSTHKEFADPSTVIKEEGAAEKAAPKTEGARSRVLIDPMNRANPIIRDYVTEGQNASQAPGQNADKAFSSPPSGTSAPEPNNPDMAFKIPGSEQDKKSSQTGSAGSATSATKTAPPPNPSSGSDSSSGDGRKRKRFAKKVVNIVTALLDKGIKWWALNAIDEDKVKEYEVTGEIDVDFLMQLPTGQQQTIREFFAQMCHIYEQAENDPEKEEKKQDLIDALADYFQSEDITPSPLVNVLLAFGDYAAPKIFAAIQVKAATAPVFAYFSQLNKDRASQAAQVSEDIEEVETEEVKPDKKKRKPKSKK